MVGIFVAKFGIIIIISNDELYIILKRRNLEICEHSSFFVIIDDFSKIEVPKFTKLSQLVKPIKQLRISN